MNQLILLQLKKFIFLFYFFFLFIFSYTFSQNSREDITQPKENLNTNVNNNSVTKNNANSNTNVNNNSVTKNNTNSNTNVNNNSVTKNNANSNLNASNNSVTKNNANINSSPNTTINSDSSAKTVVLNKNTRTGISKVYPIDPREIRSKLNKHSIKKFGLMTRLFFGTTYTYGKEIINGRFSSHEIKNQEAFFNQNIGGILSFNLGFSFLQSLSLYASYTYHLLFFRTITIGRYEQLHSTYTYNLQFYNKYSLKNFIHIHDIGGGIALDTKEGFVLGLSFYYSFFHLPRYYYETIEHSLDDDDNYVFIENKSIDNSIRGNGFAIGFNIGQEWKIAKGFKMGVHLIYKYHQIFFKNKVYNNKRSFGFLSDYSTELFNDTPSILQLHTIGIVMSLSFK